MALTKHKIHGNTVRRSGNADQLPLTARDIVGHGKHRRKRKPSRKRFDVNGNTTHVSMRNFGRKPRKARDA